VNITVFGSGYVGLVAGACFAETGNDVICVDVDKAKIDMLTRGEVPIYEPGLADMVQSNLEAGRIKFTTSAKEGVEASEVIFIAVGTPQDEDGAADLTYVLNVARDIGKFMNGPKVVVDKSTVPVGTAELVKKAILELSDYGVDVVSNPEFLKEGAAIDDFMKPDRVVVGVSSQKAGDVMKELYAPFVRTNNPILVMDVVSAEMTKYAANAMLATRVSFMNEVSNLCEKTGADINSVRIGIGTDARIGMSFLFPGIGYGGSCFPKDVQALINTGKKFGVDLKISKAVEDANFAQKAVIVRKITDHFGKDLKGKVFAIWGLAFKPKTDDTREAPALVVCQELVKLGAKLQAFDPEAMQSFEKRFGAKDIEYCETNYSALKNADALIVCTEWNEFRRPNFNKMKQAMKSTVVFDGRNIFEPQSMKNEGFVYYSIGRPSIL
jgi:UDPglucose 6-dehydrogenase